MSGACLMNGAEPPARRLNVGCGRDVREGWVNTDAFLEAPGIVKHDLTRTPWPWPDDSFDVVLMSHVMEHVPLLYRERDGVLRDVVFDVLEEVWRVLAPGGVFDVRVPRAGSSNGYGHPQHYRQINREWWNKVREGDSENYYSRARFIVERQSAHPLGVRASMRFPLGPSRLGLFDHVHARLPQALKRLVMRRDEMRFTLRAVKRA